MALNEKFFLAAPLDQYFVDKDSGLPLANGTITFYRDNARTTPKAVYQVTGAPPNYSYTALTDPVVLSSVGTIQNSSGDNVALYYYPYEGNPDDGNDTLDLYYVVCKSAGGVEQWTREGWPNITSGNDPTNEDTSIENQLANPQFSRVFLNEGDTTTYTVTGTTTRFSLAPDWDIEVQSAVTGTVIVQRIAVAGDSNIPTSPPFVLDIDVATSTSVRLIQRLNKNSGLWASTPGRDIYLTASITGENQNAGNAGLSIFYDDTNGVSPVEILAQNVSNGAYTTLNTSTAVPLPQSSNINTGTDGYVEIYLALAASTHVRVSSLQVVPVLSQAGANFIRYDLKSSNREQALMGDYFLPKLEAKPVESLLTGWDFPLNPAQFGESGTLPAVPAAGGVGYVWDQTIGIDLAGTATYLRNAITGGLQVSVVGASSAFYMLQYLSGSEAKKILGTKLAVNVFGYKSIVGTNVTMRVYLYRGSSAATIPLLATGTTIGTVDTSGVFTLTAANWTEIPRSGLGTAKATLNSIDTAASPSDINSDKNNYGFSQWQITDNTQIADTDKFAIVVTFDYGTANPVIVLNSISLVPGDIPCRPAPKSNSDTLIECQHYYERSYEVGTPAGSVTATGQITKVQQASDLVGAATTYAAPFDIRFKVRKKSSTPVLTYYPVQGVITAGSITTGVQSLASVTLLNVVLATFWPTPVPSNEGVSYTLVGVGVTNTTTGNTGMRGWLQLHYIADARLGVV